MTQQARGNFDVKVTPLEPHPWQQGGLGRMALDKHYHGPLEGGSRGEMLTGGDYSKGSAGYVAMERFEGTLDGRQGGFALQHNATMDQGRMLLNVVVVPGSGSGALQGINGQMQIVAAGGKHTYVLEYNLPQA